MNKIVCRPGIERFKGFIDAYNAQAEILAPNELLLLDKLKPWHDGRENAWHAIVTTAMGAHDPAPIDGRLYAQVLALFKSLSSVVEHDPLSEHPLAETLPTLDRFRATGKPPHGLTKSPIPAALIYQLAYIYQRSTDKKPGAGSTGPFKHFVTAFWDALGNEYRGEDAIKNDLIAARKARPEAFEVEQES